MKAAVILGAGFSSNSGIPVQSEIPAFLMGRHRDDEFEDAVSSILEMYIKNVFGYEHSSSYPELDDIFTCLDLSTSSGHHLGIKFTPQHLRALRRFLVYRVFSILERSFIYSKAVEGLIKKIGNTFSEVGYIILNWDTVLERYIYSILPSAGIDYCCNGKNIHREDRRSLTTLIKAAKIHGSHNWLYCDNCRTIYHDLYGSVSLKARAGFQKSDFEMFDELKSIKLSDHHVPAEICSLCGDVVSSHIATFSYRKSFRANSFPDIWNEAENILSCSGRWIFIGYSLPEADYEFKHLLKISQLKLKHTKVEKPYIDVVLLNSDSTGARYEKFFGSSIDCIYNGGIEEYMDVLGSQKA